MQLKDRGAKRDLTAGFFLIEAFFWSQYAVLLGYTSMYLLDHRFSNAAIGMVVAAAGIVSAFLQPLVASYADRPDSISLKKILLSLTCISLVIAAALLMTGHLTLCTGILYGCGIAILQLMTPLINSLGVESMNQGKRLNFGFARGGGSLAYAIVSYLIGVLAERFGTVVIPISMLLLFGALLTALFGFPFEKTGTVDGRIPSGQKERKAQEGSFFKRYPRYTVTLLGCVLIYTSHSIVNNFAFQIVTSKGGGSAETGTGMAIAAIVELVPMFLFVYMIRKVRSDLLFRLSGIFFALKIGGTLLAPGIMTYYGVQVFQMFGWGLMTVASVYYVNAIMHPEDVVKGQAYMTMTFTLGSVIGAAGGGRLMDAGGVQAMLLFGTAAAVLGMIIVLLTAQKTEKGEQAA